MIDDENLLADKNLEETELENVFTKNIKVLCDAIDRQDERKTKIILFLVTYAFIKTVILVAVFLILALS